MKFEELTSSNLSRFSYAQLLECDEWKERREEILSRDNYYCSKCNSSEPLKHMNYAIFFKKQHLVKNESIIETSIPLDDFKVRFDILEIKIFKNPFVKLLYGVTDKYTILAVDQNLIKNEGNKSMMVNYFHNNVNGCIMPIIEKIGSKRQAIPIPYIIPINFSSPLQVHHKYYIHKRLPWKYEDDAFITYCAKCHQEFHDYNNVKVYSEIGGILKEINYTPCKRCNGSGFLSQYLHVQNGICFRCKGARFEEMLV